MSPPLRPRHAAGTNELSVSPVMSYRGIRGNASANASANASPVMSYRGPVHTLPTPAPPHTSPGITYRDEHPGGTGGNGNLCRSPPTPPLHASPAMSSRDGRALSSPPGTGPPPSPSLVCTSELIFGDTGNQSRCPAFPSEVLDPPGSFSRPVSRGAASPSGGHPCPTSRHHCHQSLHPGALSGGGARLGSPLSSSSFILILTFIFVIFSILRHFHHLLFPSFASFSSVSYTNYPLNFHFIFFVIFLHSRLP